MSTSRVKSLILVLKTTFFLSFFLWQASKWSFQTIWGKVLFKLLSATLPAMGRVNLSARTMTAGAAVTPSFLNVTAHIWTSRPWRRAWRGSRRHGGFCSRSLRNQVGKTDNREDLPFTAAAVNIKAIKTSMRSLTQRGSEVEFKCDMSNIKTEHEEDAIFMFLPTWLMVWYVVARCQCWALVSCLHIEHSESGRISAAKLNIQVRKEKIYIWKSTCSGERCFFVITFRGCFRITVWLVWGFILSYASVLVDTVQECQLWMHINNISGHCSKTARETQRPEFLTKSR